MRHVRADRDGVWGVQMNNREPLIHVKYYKVICLCIIFSQ